MPRYIEYTADHEEPKCGRCDHACDDFKCEKYCGAEPGWWGYRRTERKDDHGGVH